MGPPGSTEAGPSPAPPGGDAVTFAERLMQLLEEASFSTTYKHALLLALMDSCLEMADEHGRAPTQFQVNDLAERVIALCWPHATRYPQGPTLEPLRQSGTGRAEIVSLVQRARVGERGRDRALTEVRSSAVWPRLVDDVVGSWLDAAPRLQRVGTAERRFLYDIGWDHKLTRRAWRSGAIDTRVWPRPGAGVSSSPLTSVT